MKFKDDSDEALAFSFGEDNDSDDLDKLEDVPGGRPLNVWTAPGI